MTPDQAADLMGRAIRRIVPDADLDGAGPDADLRRAFELDSLDFLSLVEMVSTEAAVRIDEEDYPELATMTSSTEYLVRRTATG